MNIEAKAIHHSTSLVQARPKVEISAALGEFCLRVEEKQFKAMVELLGEVTDYGQTLRKQ